MPQFRLFCLLAVLAPCALRAQYGDQGGDQGSEQKAPPEDEIPDFGNLNDYIYQPKTTLNFGFRNMSGVKASFSGSAIVLAPESPTAPTAGAPVETFHDGTIGLDTRTITQDNGDGTSGTVPVPADGKTNTWSYTTASQATSDGFMTFHTYSDTAAAADGSDQKGKRNTGMEISVSRDMGQFRNKLSWKLFGGLSINDIQASTFATIQSKLTTNTYYYDLFGQTAPGPGNFPSTTSINVVDANGNQVLDSTGAAVTQNVTNSPLLGNTPLAQTTNTTADFTSLVDHWKLHGAYATFRGGPQLVYQINNHLKATFSVGPAIIYAGTFYDVTEELTPATGQPIVQDIVDTTSRIVPAVYADADVEYDVNERTGFYVGAVYQDGGSYLQTASNSTMGTYKTKVDFSNQNGLRTGLSFKF
jgi:hypothetical protein